MGYKPRTCLELNIFHIEKTLKKLENYEITIQNCGLNDRFDKLEEQSREWYDELYPKYIQVVKKLNKDF